MAADDIGGRALALLVLGFFGYMVYYKIKYGTIPDFKEMFDFKGMMKK